MAHGREHGSAHGRAHGLLRIPNVKVNVHTYTERVYVTITQSDIADMELVTDIAMSPATPTHPFVVHLSTDNFIIAAMGEPCPRSHSTVSLS